MPQRPLIKRDNDNAVLQQVEQEYSHEESAFKMNTTLFTAMTSVTTNLLMSGYMFSASEVTLPLLYPLPASTTTPLFHGVYHRGAAMVIPGTLISTIASAYLAYNANATSIRNLYAASASIVFAMLPFTATVMMPGIHRLIHISSADSKEQEKLQHSGEVTKLLKAWAFQNWVRVGMSAASGMLSLYAVAIERAWA
jgi:hypothetical protein